MSDPYFQQLFAERIGGANYGKGTAIYKFEKIKRAKRKALADHPERALVDFGIGENDEMAPAQVRAVMAARDQPAGEPRLRRQRHRGLSAKRSPGSCSAISASQLDPATEINHCIGSKTALAMLPAAFINPGDVTLMTVPGYPVAGTHTKYYGGAVYRAAAARARTAFCPTWSPFRPTCCGGPSCWCCTIPTARPARWPRATFIRRVIEFAQRHQHRGRAGRGPHHADLRGSRR